MWLRSHVGGKEILLCIRCWQLRCREECWLLSKGRFPLTENQWVRAFIGRGRGLHVEKAQLSLTANLNVCSGLTNIILIILSTVNLHFQGWSVPVSLRQILGIVADFMSWLQSGPHVVDFFHLMRVSVSIRQLTRCRSEYYLQILRRN